MTTIQLSSRGGGTRTPSVLPPTQVACQLAYTPWRQSDKDCRVY